MKPLFIAILICITFSGYSQNKKILDSLEVILPQQSGTNRSKVLYDLIYGYMRSDVKRAELLLNQLESSANTDDASKAYACLAKGIHHNGTGKLDSGLILVETARKHALASNDYACQLRLYNALSITYLYSGKAEKALESLFKGLELINIHPDQEIEYRLRTSVVWAYLELKQYRKGIDFGLKNLKVMEKPSRFSWVAVYTYNNIAVCYGGAGKLDSAKYFITKGMDLARKNNDLQILANAYFILGTVYSNAGEFKLALEQYEQGLPIRQKLSNPLFIVSDMYTMADLYYKTGDFRKGIDVASEALKIVEKHNLKLKYENTYLALARNYEGANDFRNAAKYYKLFASAKDTAYTNANATAIAEMQTKYETEKKEKQLALQQIEIVQKDAQIVQTYFIIFILVIVLIASVLTFSLIRARMKRKQMILENEKEVQVREAHMHATIQSQETERKRFAQDLHDGMGQLISALRLALHGINSNSTTEERLIVAGKGEKILNAMYEEIRGIAFNLMPQTLVKHGLVPALREMCERLNGSEDVSVELNSFDMPARLSEVQEISLYRIIQELVNNIIKYSGARKIQLQLTGYEDECNVVIEDNGRGFNPLILEESKGNGWRNIKSRLSLIKATIEIDSREGMTGTTTILSIPLNRAEQTDEAQTSNEMNPLTVAPNTL